MMRTQLAVLALPAAIGAMFFGYHAVKLLLLAMVTAVIAEGCCNRIRHLKVPGSMSHSVMMAVLVTLMLPATAPWYVVVLGSAGAVLLGKQFFGGLGHYVWHPALVGRVLVELFFHEQLSPRSGAIMSRGSIFWGNINGALERSLSWFDVDWFAGIDPLRSEGFLLVRPVEALRDWADLQFSDHAVEMGQYFLGHLPPLEYCLIGSVPGGIGETCTLALLLVGIYLVYRGYVHWQLPLTFVLSAYVAAMILPIVVDRADSPGQVVMLPIMSESLSVGFTYLNYQLFSGGLLLGACIVAADSTSRPMTVKGQVIFAAGAGLMTMVFRLYSPLGIPCYAAILAMNTLVFTIDRLTRPRGPGSAKAKT